MAKIKAFYDTASFTTLLSNRLRQSFTNLGITDTVRLSALPPLYINILNNLYGNVNVIYESSQFATFVDFIGKFVDSQNTNQWLKVQDAMNKRTETITKTGTESDAGSFDNDPTTNDEYRSYPIDTTASDVQSKTRSIVKGAESGETSNTKTYNTTDTHTLTDSEFENVNQYDSYIFNFLKTNINNMLSLIRIDMTLCNPLSDDSTLLELEF